MEIVRLGQGVDKTGRLDDGALARTFEAAERFAKLMRIHDVERSRMVATAATRDAENSDVFVRGIVDRIGVKPEVITGAMEAELGYRGALSAGRGWAAPAMTVDIGGGSTEFVLGRGPEIESVISVPMGCVRMTERHLRHDPPSITEIEAVREDVVGLLDRVSETIDFGSVETLVGLAGSVTTLTAEALHLDSYQPQYIDGAQIAVGDVLKAVDFMVTAPRDVRLARGYMHPGRVDVIGGGAIVWSEIIKRVASEVAARGGRLDRVVTSERDILDGIALTA
ncbi:exopolyphosphatase / guanosine-5'-triphosphate,3'-diphosphate pyrophosphatase [Ruaniaceae bacterium KH17]|nr:exopolyphosphatase / guanosine-5'-triphosphate,3'-diphosphate pyrophosphatase [Ruaniaceae bacterium KH17]